MVLRIAIVALLLASFTSAQEKKPAAAVKAKPTEPAPALAIAWASAPQLDVTSISGALSVSNQSETDLDETILVVAVNEIGKAFAIGYQHFTLARHQLNVPIPFGLKLPPGRYLVHADAIAEVLSTHKVYRAGLQTPPTFVITVI